MFRKAVRVTVASIMVLSLLGNRAEASLSKRALLFKDVSAGLFTTCAIDQSDHLFCWGDNTYGGLGNGTTDASTTPVPVGMPLTFEYIAKVDTAGYTTCAVTTAGALYCWGANSYGNIGNDTTDIQLSPVFIDGGVLAGKFVADVAVDQFNTCALTLDGMVACWGYGDLGTNGDGTTSDRHVPVAVVGGAMAGRSATSISMGNGGVCATTSDHKLVCWGRAWSVSGGSSSSTVPKLVRTGYLRGKGTQSSTVNGHICAVTTEQKLACWGANDHGALGDGSPNMSFSPLLINTGSLTNKLITSVGVSGSYASCALTTRKKVSCWGHNEFGQLGIGNTTDQPVPVAVNRGALRRAKVSKISVGMFHACAITLAGKVVCWGKNDYGQLGDATINNHSTPKPIVTVE